MEILLKDVFKVLSIKLIIELPKKVMMNKFFFLLSSFILVAIASESKSFALSQPEMQMMLVGSIGAVCEMHNENNLSASIAKIYTSQYFYHANEMLSKSEVEDIKFAVLNNYPSCPFPE